MFALVLAGGKGERMRPLTDQIPKPLVPVLDRPLVWYQLQWLKRAGVTDVIFCCGYRWEALRSHFGDGSAEGLRIQYSVEEQPLGRGGAFRQAFALIPESEREVFACNGDVVTSEPPDDMLATHRRHDAVATVLLSPLRSPYGVVDVDENGLIRSFREKPVLDYWINAGVYIFDRSIEPMLPERGDHETSTFPQLASEGRLAAHRSRAFWRAVDNLKDLHEMEADVRANMLGATV